MGAKRFSLEGTEALIPALDAILSCCSSHGVQDVFLGMAHRGRLNVLVNILGKSLHQVFEEFEDFDADTPEGSGDVKYHLGASGEYQGNGGGPVRVTLASNPSHLESVCLLLMLIKFCLAPPYLMTNPLLKDNHPPVGKKRLLDLSQKLV